MIAKFAKHVFSFFEPLGPRLISNFAKSSNMIEKKIDFSKKCNMCIKKRRIFYADIETVKKAAKRLRRKK
jgi:hypothetical protein